MPQLRHINIDILKGIGIILVILGHVHKGGVYGWIYSFHMPLFFILSGLFFKPSNELFFIKFKRIIIPYLFFAVSIYLYWRFFEVKYRHDTGGININTHCLDIFWQQSTFCFDAPLWFLPCLFLIFIVSNIFFSFCNNKVLAFFMTIFFFFVINNIFVDYSCFWFKEAMFAFPFFIIGYFASSFLSRYDSLVDRFSLWLKCLFLSLLGIVFFIPNGGDMMSSAYPNGYWYYFVVAIISIICLYISCGIFTNQKWLVWLGKNSLILMCLHMPLVNIIKNLLSLITHFDNDYIMHSLPLGIVMTMLIILILVPVCIFINKKMPWVLGKF
ncbi:MAG: acyltransferase family protein [Bacteroidales bacterium]|nr:acyltransferase family protein [Bacteroidales bacterium]